jgi:hypothetical protein
MTRRLGAGAKILHRWECQTVDGNEDREKLTERESLGASLRGELRPLGADLSEIGLDLLVESDFLRSLPVMSFVTATFDSYKAVKAYLRRRKILSFLGEIADAPSEKQKAYAEKLAADAGSRENAGAALLLLLERLDDIEKAALVGRLYRTYLEGRIDYSCLRRFCSIVDRAFLSDLAELSRSKTVDGFSRETGAHLYSLGLLAVAGEDLNGWPDGSPGSKFTYAVNDLGRRFLDSAFSS